MSITRRKMGIRREQSYRQSYPFFRKLSHFIPIIPIVAGLSGTGLDLNGFSRRREPALLLLSLYLVLKFVGS